jgi:translation initiation factor 3 subunit G
LGSGPENNVTYVSYETIVLDCRPKSRDEEEKDEGITKLDSSSSIVVCRHCGETGHWTLKCPKRGQIIPKGMDKDDIIDAKTGPLEAGGSTNGKYVPVHMRAGASMKSVSMHRDEGCTLRVTNLSEEVTEDDLSGLFREYGHMSRVYLAKHGNVSRGFAFISYSDRNCAQKAIDNLHGHGYDNLILHVEWAKPREENPDAAQHISARGQGARKF